MFYRHALYAILQMKTLPKIYGGLTLLLILDTVLYLSKGISLRGQLSDWLLFWSWTSFTFILVGINFGRRWAKVYSIALIIFALLTMLPMTIPFLTIAAFALNGKKERYKLNDRIELQEYAKSVVSKPTIVAIKSFGFYEQIVGETDFEFEVKGNYLRIQDAESIRQLQEGGVDSLKVQFKFKEGLITRTM